MVFLVLIIMWPLMPNLNVAGGDITAAVDALSRFGTVQALASPRLTVLN